MGFAAIGDGDKFDFLPIPGEFCNPESDQKQRDLFKQYPKDEGIINLYAHYLGLYANWYKTAVLQNRQPAFYGQSSAIAWLKIVRNKPLQLNGFGGALR